MTRRCSHCSNNGHNSRTCQNKGGASGGAAAGSGSGGVKLFGVRLTDGSIMKKSASMGNLSHYSSSSAAASPNPSSPSSDPFQDPVHVTEGYLSDDPNRASATANRRAERKKGVPWTEDEHRMFLLGLQKLGKGDWRGISRNYVPSRTPTQVASHAQKYFIRQTNASRRRRRSSLFDMVPELGADNTLALAEDQFMLPPQVVDTSKEKLVSPLEDDAEKTMPSLDLSLKPDFEPMEALPSEMMEEVTATIGTIPIPKPKPVPELPPMIPAFFPAFVPIPFGLWPPNMVPMEVETAAEASHHQILKPTPVLPKQPANVDAVVGMSQLSLVENGPDPTESTTTRLSLNITPETTRQSAFHASTPLIGSGMTKEEEKTGSFPA